MENLNQLPPAKAPFKNKPFVIVIVVASLLFGAFFIYMRFGGIIAYMFLRLADRERIVRYSDGDKACTSDTDCQADCYLPALNTGNPSYQHDRNGFIIGKCVPTSNFFSYNCYRERQLPSPITNLPDTDFAICP